MHFTPKQKQYLGKYINAKYLDFEFISQLKHDFHTRDGVQHIVLDNFLNPQILEKILSDLNNNTFKNKGYHKTKIKIGGGLFMKGKFLWETQNMFYSKAFHEFLSFLFGYTVYPYGSNRIGYKLERLFDRGMNLQTYEKGHYLDWHTDGPLPKIKGTFVLYLNQKWNKSDGGILQLGKWNGMQVEAYKSIDPILNRIVFIKTQENISWHKVTPVMSDTIRYSFHDQII